MDLEGRKQSDEAKLILQSFSEGQSWMKLRNCGPGMQLCLVYATANVFLRRMVKDISGKAIPIRRLTAIRFYDFTMRGSLLNNKRDLIQTNVIRRIIYLFHKIKLELNTSRQQGIVEIEKQ